MRPRIVTRLTSSMAGSAELVTLDRENVPPGFLRELRVAVFNRMHSQLTAEDANSEWAEAAVASPDCRAEAVESYLGRRFGAKRVAFDPSDPEANNLAVSHGYTVVHGSWALSSRQRRAASRVLASSFQSFATVCDSTFFTSNPFAFSPLAAAKMDALSCLRKAVFKWGGFVP